MPFPNLDLTVSNSAKKGPERRATVTTPTPSPTLTEPNIVLRVWTDSPRAKVRMTITIIAEYLDMNWRILQIAFGSVLSKGQNIDSMEATTTHSLEVIPERADAVPCPSLFAAFSICSTFKPGIRES